MAQSTALNPAQREVLAVLGANLADRPEFDPDLCTRLRTELEDGIEPLLGENVTADDPLYVNKHDLAAVHGCEARFLGEEGVPFAWSVPVARGSVAHKAIELAVHWRGDAVPLELVDEALAGLEQGDDGLGQYLRACSELERAELRAEANDRIVKFLECWPPLKKEWRPVTESRLKPTLCDDRVVLAGKVDLTLGGAQGTIAGKVLIDLKTGTFSPNHQDDLRFYALVETLRLGTPPRRLASYYLDGGSFRPEDVTEELLRSAARRTIDGVRKMLELTEGRRDPARQPGPPCWWCALRDDCGPGRTWVAEQLDA